MTGKVMPLRERDTGTIQAAADASGLSKVSTRLASYKISAHPGSLAVDLGQPDGGTRTPSLLIRGSMCGGRPGPFRSVRDLRRVLVGCSWKSGESGCGSSVWLPAWLPVVLGARHLGPARGHHSGACLSTRSPHGLRAVLIRTTLLDSAVPFVNGRDRWLPRGHRHEDMKPSSVLSYY
jgi:hypothetical protein